MKKKLTCATIRNYFLVYLPVILLLLLIFTVYATYFSTYLYILITTDPDTPDELFILHPTTSAKSAKTKGICLLVFTLFFFSMLMMSMLYTVFADPGYFPNPIELEYKIIEFSQKQKNKLRESQIFSSNKFITKISSTIINGPMTAGEKKEFDDQLKKKCKENPTEDKLNVKYSNEEIIIANKKNYMKYYKSGKYNNDIEYNAVPHTHFENSENIFLNIYQGLDLSKMNFCGTCLRIKVERSHHCRMCQKCVLKMDHHCPWLANCIGYGNLKAFILTQFYGVISCSFVLFSYWETIVDYNLSYSSNVGECWIAISIYIINIGLLAFILWLCYVNWYNLYKGMTVIEHSEKKRYPTTKSINIYDMGPYRNFTNVFCTNPLLWPLPFVKNTKGGGFVFETNSNSTEFYIQ